MNPDTILYLDERATRQACGHFDPVGVVTTAYRRAAGSGTAGGGCVVTSVGDPRLTVLVDRWMWLDACVISSAYLAGLRLAAPASAIAARLLPGPVTAGLLGGTVETVEALARTLPGLAHLSVCAVREGSGGSALAAVAGMLRDSGTGLAITTSAAEAVYGANLVLLAPGAPAVDPAWLARDALVLGGAITIGRTYPLPALFASPARRHEGLVAVDLGDGGVASTVLATEIYRVALRLDLGRRLRR
jgi:hypothetical protein